MFDMAAMSGRKSQAEIAEAEHVSITGQITGECAGTLRIDLIEQDFQTDDPSETNRPLSTLEVEKPGPFTMVSPSGVNVSIGAACDGDKDGVINGSADGFVFPTALNKLWADLEGVQLQLASLNAPPPPPPGSVSPPSPDGKATEGKPAEPPKEGAPPVPPAGAAPVAGEAAKPDKPAGE